MPDSSAWTIFHDRLHQTLKQRSLLQKQQRILLAVSGGQDSLCLTKLMLELQPKWQWELAIAHCNHQWRADADANAQHVQQLAESWGVLCFIANTSTSLKSEAAARAWRYEQLGAIALDHHYTAVVLGHTASDRAETLLYNLFRGSGADGLQALTWQRELQAGIALVRPLLEFTRDETYQVCQNYALPIWEDTTNHDLTYARNRIRQDVLPYLKSHFNPQIEMALAQTAELLRADVDYLETCAVNLLQQAVCFSAETAQPGSSKINRLQLQGVELALQRRTLRQFLKTQLPTAPTFYDVEKLRSLIHAPNRSQTAPFPGGAIAFVEGEWIKFAPKQQS